MQSFDDVVFGTTCCARNDEASWVGTSRPKNQQLAEKSPPWEDGVNQDVAVTGVMSASGVLDDVLGKRVSKVAEPWCGEIMIFPLISSLGTTNG